MPYLKTRDGTEIYFKDWGRGRPVILIHGWPLSADSWDRIAMGLANAGLRAIAYDRRGFGRSDQPWTGYDYDRLSDDLRDVMEACGARENVALIGFSMGGGEVARYMSRHRASGITHAVLISSVVPYLLQTDDNPDGVPKALFDGMAEQINRDRPAFMATFFKQFFGVTLLSSPVGSEKLDWAWNVAMQAGLKPTLAAAQAFATTDFRQDLPSFTIPTLIIHGTNDKTVPVQATGRAAARGIPHSKFVEYDGEPHGLFETQPDRLLADLLGFLRDGGSSEPFMLSERSRDALGSPSDPVVSDQGGFA